MDCRHDQEEKTQATAIPTRSLPTKRKSSASGTRKCARSDALPLFDNEDISEEQGESLRWMMALIANKPRSKR